MTTDGNPTASKELVSFETRQIFETINIATLSCVTCLFGIITNVINAVIFYKQGLNTTMNISFFGLAVSDLGCLITLQWATILFNPLFASSGLPWDRQPIIHLSGGMPYMCFGRITCWITTYITAERCLCIALPLKVNQIITPRRTTVIVCVLYIMNIASFIPEYLYSYLGWVFDPKKNSTYLTIVFREENENLSGVSFILIAITGSASFPAVIIFTLILVIKLDRQAKWRHTSATGTNSAEVTSKRDIKTMNMVVVIASVLIFCYTPGIIAALATFVVPGFTIDGIDKNLFYIAWTFAALFQAINSSINIFFYYRMSSKYKTTFHEIFELWLKPCRGNYGSAAPVKPIKSFSKESY